MPVNETDSGKGVNKHTPAEKADSIKQPQTSIESITNLNKIVIFTDQDLKEAISLLSEVSPFGKELAEIIAQQKISVVVLDTPRSKVYKNLYTVLHRDTEWAGQIVIRKGASIFDVIHEYTHAIPVEKLPKILSLNEIPTIDASANVIEIAEQVRFVTFFDEALSRAAELETIKDFRSRGIYYVYDPPELQDVYDVSGVLGIAQRHSEFFPQDDEQYQSVADKIAPLLKQPKGVLLNTQWNDVLDEFGMTKPEGVDDHGKFQLDFTKMESAVRAQLASMTPEQIEDKLKQYAAPTRHVIEAYIQEQREPIVTSEGIENQTEASTELPKVLFEPRKQPKDLLSPVIAQFPDETRCRVSIAGKFSELLSQMSDLKDDEITSLFEEGLILAERSYGEQSADLYRDLYSIAQKFEKNSSNDNRAKPDLLRKLGFSLLRAGYERQGKEILFYFANEHARNLSLKDLGTFSENAIKNGQGEVMLSVLKDTQRRVQLMEDSFPSKLVEHYTKNYSSDEDTPFFTKNGELQIRNYFDQLPRNNALPTARGFHTLVLSLYRSGDYVLGDNWQKDSLIEKPPTHLEESYFQSLVIISESVTSFSRSAQLLRQDFPPLASECEELTRKMYKLSIVGAKEIFRHHVEEWEDEFPPAQYEPGIGLYKFIQEILQHKESNKDFDFLETAMREIKSVVWNTAKDADFINERLEFLYWVPESGNKLSLFSDIADTLPRDLPDATFQKFIQEWESTLTIQCEEVFANKGIEIAGTIKQDQFLIKEDTGIRPERPTSTHLFFEHQRKIIKLLTARPSDAYHQQALEKLLSLPDSDEVFFNPHRYISPEATLFTEPHGYNIYTAYQSHTRLMKARSFLHCAHFFPQLSSQLVDEASDLIEIANATKNTTDFNAVEDRVYLFIELLDAQIAERKVEKAVSTYRTLAIILDQAGKSCRQRLLDFKKLPQEQQNEDYHSKWEIEGNSKRIKFWQQHFDTRVKSKIVELMNKSGNDDSANQMIDELVQGFRSEVDRRLDNFDIRSMIVASGTIADLEGTQMQGFDLFVTCVEKLSLLRGKNDEVFKKSVTLFFDHVCKTKLATEAKDTLLHKLVSHLTPNDMKDFKEMTATLPGLLELAAKVSDAGIYPKTEKEILRILEQITNQMQFDRNHSFKNEGQLLSLKEAFAYITEKHPEIMYGENFEQLTAVSSESQYTTYLSELMPQEAAVYFSGEVLHEGIFNLDKIRSGFYDKESTYTLALEELKRVQSSPEMVPDKLIPILTVYKELISQEVVSFRKAKPPHYVMTLSDLHSLRGVTDLWEMLDRKILNKTLELQPFDQQVIETLFAAPNIEDAINKYPLFEKFLGNDEAPLFVQRTAFREFIHSGQISTFVKNYFEQLIIPGDTKMELAFYTWIKELLATNNGKLLHDRVMAFLLENPHRSDEFFVRYRKALGRNTVPEKLENSKVERGALDNYFRGSREDFFKVWQEFVKEGNFWVPELSSDIDLILAYEMRFSWFVTFEQFIANIRYVYIYEAYDTSRPSDYKFVYTPDQIAAEIQMFLPNFELDAEKKTKIETIFANNKSSHQSHDRNEVLRIDRNKGNLSFNQLKEVTGELSLTSEQKTHLETFLTRVQELDLLIVQRTFGQAKRESSWLKGYKEFLNVTLQKFSSRAEKITQAELKLPEVFKELPEVVQFILTRYFIQLPFGEREAILDEFDKESDTISPQKAIKRFFELTGTEKVGQFLSMRRDLIPEDYRKELEEFQEEVKPSAFQEVRKTIESEFGKTLESVYASFSKTPLNVGTIGEVYEAETLDGKKVVVKVITQSKRESVARTLGRLNIVCQDIQRSKERFKGTYDPLSMFEEFRTSIEEELDFRRELVNAEDMRKDLPRGITIPIYIPDLCRESVLTQSYAQGKHINELKDSRLKKSVTEKLGDMLVTQLIETGVFHDDLHPGNIRVNPQTGQIELLDFGRTGRANKSERENITPLLSAIQAKSEVEVIERLELGTTQKFDRKGLSLGIKKLFQENIPSSELISKILFTCGSHGLTVSPTYLRMLKAVMTFEGTAQQLDGDFELQEFLRSTAARKIKNAIRNIFTRFQN